MRMHNPPHPGEVLRELCLEPLGISVTDAAEALGVSRKTLSSILNGRFCISPEMATRLAKAFDTSPESWLNQQVQYDLWKAEQNSRKFHVRKLIAATTVFTRRRRTTSISELSPALRLGAAHCYAV